MLLLSVKMEAVQTSKSLLHFSRTILIVFKQHITPTQVFCNDNEDYSSEYLGKRMAL